MLLLLWRRRRELASEPELGREGIDGGNGGFRGASTSIYGVYRV